MASVAAMTASVASSLSSLTLHSKPCFGLSSREALALLSTCSSGPFVAFDGSSGLLCFPKRRTEAGTRRCCSTNFRVSAAYEPESRESGGSSGGTGAKSPTKLKPRKSKGFGAKSGEASSQKTKGGLSSVVENSPNVSEDGSSRGGVGFGQSRGEGGVRRRPAPQKPLVAVQPTEQEKQIDNGAVVLLGILFGVIFLEGTFLAVAGFLPESLDTFAVDVVYPAFTPSVGGFLAVAAFYGLYKYLGVPGQK